MADTLDSARFSAIATGMAVTVNDWLVQVIADKHWHTAYFAEPPGGKPATIYPTKLDALRAAVDEAIATRMRRAILAGGEG